VTETTDRILDFSNDGLRLALQQVARDPSTETRRAFYEALTAGTLILLAPRDLAADGDPGDAPEDIPLLTFVDDAGDAVLIGFTDEDAVLAWDPDDPALVALRGLDVVLIAAQNDIDTIVLNPGSPASYRMHRDEFAAAASGEHIASQAEARSTAEGTTVYITPPEVQPPEGWLRAVRRVLQNYPSILSAFFFYFRLASGDASHVIGLEPFGEMSHKAQNALIKAVLADFQDLLPEERTLDFVVLDDPEFLAGVREIVKPFHTRA